MTGYRPVRVQRQRTKGWKTPLCGCGCGTPTRYVGRPTIWGNPYTVERVGKTTWHVMHGSWVCATFHSRSAADARGDAVQRLRLLMAHDRDPWGANRIRAELAGHDLMCWCPLDQPCHADLLLSVANGVPA